VGEFSGKRRSGGNRVLFLYTSHSHAQVLAFYYYRNSSRIQRFLNAIPYFIGKPFLYLQAAGKSIYYTRNFTETNNVSLWNVSNVCLSEKG
jgi:hypothetical protein